jgi:hypothetical protein
VPELLDLQRSGSAIPLEATVGSAIEHAAKLVDDKTSVRFKDMFIDNEDDDSDSIGLAEDSHTKKRSYWINVYSTVANVEGDHGAAARDAGNEAAAKDAGNGAAAKDAGNGAAKDSPRSRRCRRDFVLELCGGSEKFAEFARVSQEGYGASMKLVGRWRGDNCRLADKVTGEHDLMSAGTSRHVRFRAEPDTAAKQAASIASTGWPASNRGEHSGESRVDKKITSGFGVHYGLTSDTPL